MFQNVSSADASVFSRHLCIPCFLNLILISIKKFHFPEIRHITLLSKVLFMSFFKNSAKFRYGFDDSADKKYDSKPLAKLFIP